MKVFEPEVLATSYTNALFGAETIKEKLTDYRDAIRHIATETRNGMDQGLTLDELALLIKSPPELSEKPYLRE